MTSSGNNGNLTGTIVLSTVGRPDYGFDVYGVHLPLGIGARRSGEVRLTNGRSVNSNGHLVEGDARTHSLNWIKETSVDDADFAKSTEVIDAAMKGLHDLLVYVSEETGRLALAFSIVTSRKWMNSGTSINSKPADEADMSFGEWEEALQGSDSEDGEVLLSGRLSLGAISSRTYMEDRPQFGGGRVVFVSTVQDPDQERHSWAAVYSFAMHSRKPNAVRLTPPKVNDFSPALSPSGEWVVAASLQNHGWTGEVDGLNTDLYVFSAADGSQRRLVTKNGGWPTWQDDSTVFFHRRADDGWWSIFKVSLPRDFLTGGGHYDDGLPARRVIPSSLMKHAFTPSASRTGKWIAVATRKPDSDVRHVEIFHLDSKKFTQVTQHINPNTSHYNPFVSPSSSKLIYHHTRQGILAVRPRLERLKSPITGLDLLRVAGFFPVLSHDKSMLLAYITGLGKDGKIVVTDLNGGGTRTIFTGEKPKFSLAWDWQRMVVYTAYGNPHLDESGVVHIISIPDADTRTGDDPPYKQLTKDGTKNNAFPSASPDGTKLVFRSSRNGNKNLYIMDAVNGEDFEDAEQITDGEWTDTMPNWSPSGDFIAFSSDRDDPNRDENRNLAHFSGYIYDVHTKTSVCILKDGGRVNHLFFSPDSQSLAFASDFAAVSSEPIAVPNQPMPFGELYISAADGSSPQRLTHNPYEDSLPCWSPQCATNVGLALNDMEPAQPFDDVDWLPVPEKQDEGDDSPPKMVEAVRGTWCQIGRGKWSDVRRLVKCSQPFLAACSRGETL